MRNLAVIPARSGSKGLKDKNIKELLGKPLLAYSIEAALQSEVFDEVHVSTDSREYADLAQKYGADVTPSVESARPRKVPASVVPTEINKGRYRVGFDSTLAYPARPNCFGHNLIP